MDTEKYAALLTIIEQSSLTIAAQKLDYTTSGISRLVKSLEDETGCKLLERSHKGAAPTQECLELLPSIKDFLASGEAVRHKALALRGLECGTVTIGTAYPCFYEPIAKSIRSFHAEHPRVQIILRNAYSMELAEAVEAGELDFAIISRREGNFCWQELMRDPLMAWVPKNSPLTQNERVPLSAYGEFPYIDIFAGYAVDNQKVFEQHGISPHTAFTTSDSHAAEAMVAAGLGIAMNNGLNSRELRERIKVLPLEPDIEISIGIAAKSHLSHAAQSYMQYAMKMCNECQAEKEAR